MGSRHSGLIFWQFNDCSFCLRGFPKTIDFRESLATDLVCYRGGKLCRSHGHQVRLHEPASRNLRRARSIP